MTMQSIFVMTEEHLTLLRHMYVSWDDGEFGAPAIDCKRPYGNSSVIADMREILKHDDNACPHCGEPLDEAKSQQSKTRLEKLHKETQIALQIVLSTGKFEPGKYRLTEPYVSTSWKLVTP